MMRGLWLWCCLAAGAGAVPWTDGMGRMVEVPEAPKRLLSISPSMTELLFAAGAGGRLVGATQHCTYPPAALSLERIGGSMTPNIEKIVSLKPDLVLGDVTTTVSKERVQLMERAGLSVVIFRMQTAAEMVEGLRQVGRLCNVTLSTEPAARALTARLRAVRTAVKTRPRPTVLVVVWAEPLWTVGGSSFVHDAIEVAGGRNVAEDIKKPSTTFSMEEVVKRNPDWIVLAFHEASPTRLSPVWQRLRAVKQGRCVAVDPDRLVRAGPRLVDAIEALARILHPRAFRPLLP